MKVEMLYFQGCPHHEPALERVRNVLAAEGITADVLQIEVPNARAAESLRFLGSPSIRINGIDVEGLAPLTGAVGLTCRAYLHGSVREGVPPAEMIRRAIRNARKSDENC
jgi:hypothetical protein